MAESQTTHPIYELKVDVSNTSRLFEYYMLKDYIKSSDVVLDIGCNTGTGMDILSGFSDSVYGIDVVPELKEILENKYKDNPKIHFEIVKEGDMHFAPEFFDVIVANNFIEHVEKPDYYLKKFHTLLKPNGRLYLTTVNRKNRLYFWQKPYNKHHYTEYSKKTLERVLTNVFDKVNCLGIVKNPPFFPDYVASASERKFNNGIKYPIINFLKKIKRGIFPEKRKNVIDEKMSDNKMTKIASENFELKDFEKSFSYINIDQTNEEKWVELFAICTK